MFVGVRPYVALFRQFFILVKFGRSKDELGAYYFQARAIPSTPYIPAFANGKWDLWRTEWVIARADANERLDLPTSEPASDHKAWRAKPSLPSEFDPVLEKIKALAEGGLTLMHVVGDFLNHRITPPVAEVTDGLELHRLQRLQQGPARGGRRPDPRGAGGHGARDDRGKASFRII